MLSSAGGAAGPRKSGNWSGSDFRSWRHWDLCGWTSAAKEAVVADMADLPPDNDDDEPNYPESGFLIRLWGHLDAAADLSVVAGVLSHLDEIADHCERAIAEIRAWQRDNN